MQRPCLLDVARLFEQVAQAAHRGAFVVRGGPGQLARIGACAEVLGDLRHAVEATGPMHVAHAVEQRQLDAGHDGEAGRRLDRLDERRFVAGGKGLGLLVDELQAMRAERQIAQLARRHDLEDHGRLMRRAVMRCRAQQRYAVAQALMLHQRVDPFGRVRGACRSVFGPHDEIEAMPRVGQLALGDSTRERRRQRAKGDAGRDRFVAAEPAPPCGEAVVDEGVQGGHAEAYANSD